jgi:hypothetical protein
LRFADRAAQVARHEPSPRLHALIALRQAAAYAELGDELAFRSSITTARRELDRGPHPADPSWARFVSESEITGHEAMGRARLGDPSWAARLYRTVLDDRGRSLRDHAYYRARLADALLSVGDITLAIAEGAAVLPSLGNGQMTSAHTLNQLRSLRGAAEQAGDEEFCARFDEASCVLVA